MGPNFKKGAFAYGAEGAVVSVLFRATVTRKWPLHRGQRGSDRNPHRPFSLSILVGATALAQK